MSQTAMTLKKLSVLSGYSISTVSKALNGKKDISSNARNTIKEIAKKANYTPNYAAIALRKQVTKTFAVIVPQIGESKTAKFLSEIQKLSFIYEYRLLVFQSFNSHKKEIECINLINDGSVDGMILVSNNDKVSSIVKNQRKYYKLPIVCLNNFDLEHNSNEKTLFQFNNLLAKIN